MSATVTIDEAQANLKELIGKLTNGDEVIITDNLRRVAKLVAEPSRVQRRPDPGLCKGMITIGVDDEEHLKDFAKYMP